MGWVLGFVVYALIWWTALFAVLPLGVRPQTDSTIEEGGWRGAPSQPQLGRKLVITTAVSSVLWLVVYWFATTDAISFRDTWLAIPD